MKRIIKKVQEPFMYGVIGIIATIIDFAVLIILTDICNIDYKISIVLSFIVAAIFNFLLQKKYTFKCNHTAIGKQFLQFLALGTVGMGINFGIVVVGVEIYKIWYITGKIIATIIAFIWNYFANKYITFNKNV